MVNKLLLYQRMGKGKVTYNNAFDEFHIVVQLSVSQLYMVIGVWRVEGKKVFSRLISSNYNDYALNERRNDQTRI